MVKNPIDGKRTIRLPASLYNLAEDVMEQHNLAEQFPEKTQRMAALLTELEKGPGLRHSLK
jgi:hypothetical protein